MWDTEPAQEVFNRLQLTQAQDPLPPLSSWRIKQAQDIYQEMQTVDAAVLINDGILAYLMSWYFLGGIMIIGSFCIAPKIFSLWLNYLSRNKQGDSSE